MSAARGPVLFLDAKGQGFTRNLAALRDELLGRRPSIPARYFFADLEPDAVSAKEHRAMRRLLDRASAEASWVISASDSEYHRGCRGGDAQRRILVLGPRLALVDATAERGEPVGGYTDVVVSGSAFAAAAEAQFPGARVHALGLPMFAELVWNEARVRARAELAIACPKSAGKRVVVVTTQRSPKQVFDTSSVRDLVERLPEDVFLVLDIPDMLSVLESETPDLEERVFVNDGALGIFTLLALGDTLLTSRFRDAVYFSVTGRSLFLLNTRRNVGTLGDRLSVDYAGLGIADVFELPAALTGSYDEPARLQFQSVFAVPDPASSSARLVEALF